MLQLENPDLADDSDAVWVVKSETVDVEFAVEAGALESAVGINHYARGDAILTGSTQDRWCVSRDRFDVKYQAEPPTRTGMAGRYRNVPLALLGKRMPVPFCVSRSVGGDLLRGEAGDWLLQYAPGDHGIVAAARFASVYRVIEPECRPP